MKKKYSPTKISRILSANLTSIREGLNMDQDKFAAFVEISPSHFSEIINCRGCASYPLLESIAEKTGVTVSQLFDEKYKYSFVKDLAKRSKSASCQ